MKNFYTLIFFTIATSFLTAQTMVDFTLEEGYVQGPLEASSDWGGSNWIVNPTPGTERAETTAGYSWARWGAPFIVSDTEISFEVHFRFNIDLPAGKLISRFGFNDNGSSSGTIANIQLSTLNDGSLSVRKQGNTPVDSGSAGLTDFQQDDLVLNMVLTLGADAASSSMSSTITNVTDNINSGLAVVNGIPAAVFNAATSGGISGFIHAQDNINGTRGFLVDKVVMTQGDTPGNTETSWTGSTSSDWATAANWSTGAVPTSSDIVFIDGTFTNEPTISSTDALVNSLFVATANTLTIDQSSSLTVSGDFTNDGTVTLNSTADDFSSLIVTGTATGDITYNRYVNSYNDGLGGGWDLVGSPTVMTITDFTTANGANIQVLGSDYAFSQYNNVLDQWERYATDAQTGSFTTGQGYSMATTSDGPPPPGGVAGTAVAFTGDMQTTDQSINVINNDGVNGVGRRWNLVSNPYPSYINGNTAAQATNNFMDVNSGVIDDSFLGVYGWNGSSYTTYNFTSDAFSIAPGQGFWIAALNTEDTALNFTAAMRTTTGTGDFVAGPQPLTYHVALKLYNGDVQQAAAKFYFRDGLSLDLDPGYDAGAYNQSAKLSTRLPGGSQEFAFELNAMGIDALQNTRVPLEIRQDAGQAFRVSISEADLPEDIYVYLEDTLNGTLTSLKEGDFELVAQSDLSGVDRFFIIFKSNSVLSSGDTLGINALNVYKASNDDFVTIAGITPDLGQLDVRLYSMLGVAVKQTVLNTATATQRVSTADLASGLYIVQIKSGNQTTVKKVIVK